MMNNKNDNQKRCLYLVASMAASADRSYTIIGAPIGIYKTVDEANRTAKAEMEMQEITVDGRPFKQTTAFYELPLDDTWPDVRKINDVWIVWSNMLMQDETGRAFNCIEGFYRSEEEADQAFKTIIQGECDSQGGKAIVKSGKRRLALR